MVRPQGRARNGPGEPVDPAGPLRGRRGEAPLDRPPLLSERERLLGPDHISGSGPDPEIWSGPRRHGRSIGASPWSPRRGPDGSPAPPGPLRAPLLRVRFFPGNMVRPQETRPSVSWGLKIFSESSGPAAEVRAMVRSVLWSGKYGNQNFPCSDNTLNHAA